MAKIAVIAGTGLTGMKEFILKEERTIPTPFGDPSASIKIGLLDGIEIAFLARHGDPHRILPHHVNYRANLYALKEIGITSIIAIAAVGGITAPMHAGVIAIPHQLVDYTYSREQSIFSDTGHGLEHHVDFTEPFTQKVRELLLTSSSQLHINVVGKGVVAVVQGPRLETAAEINKLEREGCDLVNMTLMPEAGLARELAIEYASLALVVNRAAGRFEKEITIEEIVKTRDDAAEKINKILVRTVKELALI